MGEERVPQRLAPQDREGFLDLYREFLYEKPREARLLPTKATWRMVETMVDGWLVHGWRGAIFLVPEVGFSAAIEPPGSPDRPEGRVAYSLGTFVREPYRAQGVGKALRKALLVELAEQGFDGVLGGLAPGNEASRASFAWMGGRVVEATYFFPVPTFKE